MTDNETLQNFFNQDIERLEKLENLTGKIIKGAGIAGLIVLSFFIGIFSYQSNKLNKIYISAEERIETNRQLLLEGLYSVQEYALEAITSTNDRLQIFMVQGKKIILENYPHTDLSDRQINQLLRVNFQFAEEYRMNPWIFMAFAGAESDFTTRAVSVAGAKGIVQFMPSTMALVLGNKYKPDIEFDPIASVEAWYRYVSYLSLGTGGDLKWTAAAYMTPTAIAWKNEGRSLEEFMEWVVSWSQNQIRYPWKIEELVINYSNL